MDSADVSLPANDAAGRGELLARAYIDELAKAEGVTMKSLSRRPTGEDAVDALLAELEEKEDDDAPRLRADTVALAVMTAYAIAGEPGLAGRLRRENPVVTIAVHSGDLVAGVERIISDVATGRRHDKVIFARDGSEKSHSPTKGNSVFLDALVSRRAIVGIAADPKRHLPSQMLRAAEYRLTLPPLDDVGLRLVLEAVTGYRYEGPIDPMVVRSLDIDDLALALRHGLSPEQRLERLVSAISTKTAFVDGPSLEDLPGYGEARTWGLELIEDIAAFKAGLLKWEDVAHRGLLLSGDPGTGKTTFARALAKSANIPLVATSVAQWNASDHLGVTLANMRNTFGEAKRLAPCILFIDELDGISRRDTLRESAEYWLQIVNLLLELLAGIEDREGVVVLGATNHPQKIDAGIKRAGRIDREIHIELPGPEDLAEIFRFHVGPDVLKGVDFMPAALAATGRTGADVDAWVRRARAAARRAHRELVLEDIHHQISGAAKPLTLETRRAVAVHEAGHALVGVKLKMGNLLGVAITHDGGITRFDAGITGAEGADRIEAGIALAMAGREAESVLLGRVTLGGESDLATATEAAMLLETCVGGGNFGQTYLGLKQFRDIPRHPWLIGPIQKRLDEGAAQAREILEEHRELLGGIAAEVEQRGYISGVDVEAMIREGTAGPKPDSPTGTFAPGHGEPAQ